MCSQPLSILIDGPFERLDLRINVMNKQTGRAFVLCLVMASQWANADAWTSWAYRYDGGIPDFITEGRIFSAWNARNASDVLSPGVKVMFFGRADACDFDAANGPTVTYGNPRLEHSLGLTGVNFDPVHGLTWTPGGNFHKCSPSARGKAGDSFVHLNPDIDKGGVALFTYTGRDVDGRLPFFQQYDVTGKNNTGVNGFINGTFFVLRFSRNDRERIAPWSGQGSGRDPVIEFRSVQSVVRAVVPAVTSSSPKKAAQSKQQIMFTLLNRDCFRKMGGPGKLCQLQYVLNTAVYRTGVLNWDEVQWFKQPQVWFDAAQGSVPVVRCPLPAKGETARDARTGAALYTSVGEATQHVTFRDKAFGIRISFTQLKNALRAATAGRLKKDGQHTTDADVRAEFGERWDDPQEWTLLSVNAGQEVYNPSRERRAFIAGNFRSLSIGPLNATEQPVTGR